MAGQVQMFYFDPPYGIKYGSNFQPFVNKRDVKDGKDDDLTQEPEMIRAFRDTWELGIHSYLTYLRDRLLLAKDLLNESGSVFVQIGDRESSSRASNTGRNLGISELRRRSYVQEDRGATSRYMPGTCDYLVWYAKNIEKLKFRSLLMRKKPW